MGVFHPHAIDITLPFGPVASPAVARQSGHAMYLGRSLGWPSGPVGLGKPKGEAAEVWAGLRRHPPRVQLSPLLCLDPRLNPRPPEAGRGGGEKCLLSFCGAAKFCRLSTPVTSVKFPT